MRGGVPYRSDQPSHARVYQPPPSQTEEAKRERKKFYNSSAWKRLRLVKLAADPLCELCLEREEVEPAAHVHHTRKLADHPEDALNLATLQSLCLICHSRLTSQGK